MIPWGSKLYCLPCSRLVSVAPEPVPTAPVVVSAETYRGKRERLRQEKQAYYLAAKAAIKLIPKRRQY